MDLIYDSKNYCQQNVYGLPESMYVQNEKHKQQKH